MCVVDHSGFVPVSINQIIWCYTYLSVWKACAKAPHEQSQGSGKRKSLHLVIISCNTTEIVIEILFLVFVFNLFLKLRMPRSACQRSEPVLK